MGSGTGFGIGSGIGCGVGSGAGVGRGSGAGVGTGSGAGVGSGTGVGVGCGVGLGGDGSGPGCGVGWGVGVGSDRVMDPLLCGPTIVRPTPVGFNGRSTRRHLPLVPCVRACTADRELGDDVAGTRPPGQGRSSSARWSARRPSAARTWVRHEKPSASTIASSGAARSAGSNCRSAMAIDRS